MKSPRTIKTIGLFCALGLAMGCASTEPEDNNNTQNNNNVIRPDGGGTGCAATCTDPSYICVGIPDHQTCVPKCGDGMICSDSTKACCYGGCVDLQNDPNNCGSCASFCNGNCINGTCVDQCGNSCSADQDCCLGSCVNTVNDVTHCGDCDTQCDTEVANACTNGYCTCGGGAACTGGRKCCGSSCKDLLSDVTNCGSCNNACAPGETCSNGQCLCGSTTCTFGQSCCSGTCLTTTSDVNNCGSCNNVCGTNFGCYNGSCGCGGAGVTCPAGMLGEPGQCCSDGACVVFSISDPLQLISGVQNCGTCGTDCAPMSACLMGGCM